MRIHVIAGCRELLRPSILPPESAEQLLPQDVRTARAYWLCKDGGDLYHDFLQDEPGDTRTEVMAQAIIESFGSRFEPLLILPELLHEDAACGGQDRRSQHKVLFELLDTGGFDRFALYALSLSPKADPDRCWAVPAAIDTSSVANSLDDLRAEFAERMPPDSVTTQVFEVGRDMSCFKDLSNNALSNAFASNLEQRMADDGFENEPDVLRQAILDIVNDWNSNGLSVAMPLRQEHFGNFTELLYTRLRSV